MSARRGAQIARLGAAIFGSAAIMAAWSELAFHNEEPAAAFVSSLETGLLSTLAFVAELTAFYAIPSAFLIGLFGLAGAQGAARVLLIGALTGFSIEGALVPAVYEAPPVSFIWTAIAWHGPITVGLGLFLLPRLLSEGALLKNCLAALLIGSFWAVWTTWTWGDEGVRMPPAAFFGYVCATTAIMAVGYAALWFARWPDISPSRGASLALIAPSVAFLVLQGVAAPVSAVGVLFILASLSAMLWRRGRGKARRFGFRWRNAAVLAMVPVVAHAAYAVLYASGAPLNGEDLAILVAVAGFFAWVLGVVRGSRAESDELESGSDAHS